jgi:hypothetical protein
MRGRPNRPYDTDRRASSRTGPTFDQPQMLHRRALILAGITAIAACNKPDSGGSDATPTRTAAQNVANACRDVAPGATPDPDAPRPKSGFTPIALRDSLLRQLESGEQKLPHASAAIVASRSSWSCVETR